MGMGKKDTILVILAAVAKKIKYSIKNMNLLHLKYNWQSWVDWISSTHQKMLQSQKGKFSVKGLKVETCLPQFCS